MYSNGIKVLAASAGGAGTLAYTGVDTPLFLFLGAVMVVAGALLVRMARLHRGQHGTGR
ncbi:MAG: hypothetical protein J0I11_14605 [Actinobacteria bacterium]|jgi:hypothetical protein|nr:hypothetical protein [Actinomycetota bacterium]